MGDGCPDCEEWKQVARDYREATRDALAEAVSWKQTTTYWKDLALDALEDNSTALELHRMRRSDPHEYLQLPEA